MVAILEHRRVDTAVLSTLVPAAGELVVNLDDATVHVGIGDAQIGGYIIGGFPNSSHPGVTSYTILPSDMNQFITFNDASPVAVTLPQATLANNVTDGTYMVVANFGAGLVTITPTTSTINGVSTFTIAQNIAALILSDGANYWAFRFSGVSSGGGGLFNQILSATPTGTNTGLTNWLNQGSATDGNGTTGLWINQVAGTGSNVAGLYTTAVPATPYSITALISLTSGGGDGTNNPVAGLGWTDGTQMHTIQYVSAGNALPLIQIAKRTSGTATQSTDFSKQAPFSLPVWFKIRDDGTTVYFSHSYDGVNFIVDFSVAKSSGFLGSGGYSHILFNTGGAANNDGTVKIGTLLSWIQGT